MTSRSPSKGDIEKAMRELRDIRRRSARIEGILHAAGVNEDDPASDAHQAMEPKPEPRNESPESSTDDAEMKEEMAHEETLNTDDPGDDGAPDHRNDDETDDEIPDDAEENDDHGEMTPDLDDSTYEDIVGSDDDDDDDDVIMSKRDRGAARVLDSLVYYSTDGWINPRTGRPFGRIALLRNPPSVTFRQHVVGDEAGEGDTTVTMFVTRGLASDLADMFAAMRKSFDGGEVEPSKNRIPFSWHRIREWFADEWRYEPIRVVLTGVVLLAVVTALVYAAVMGS